MRFATLLGLILLASGASRLPAQEPPPQPLSVTLTSGRVFTGYIDAATGVERLVLRFTRGGASLRRPIAWDRITAAKLEGTAIEPADLRATAERLESKGPGAGNRGAGIGGREGEAPAEPRGANPHVTSVTFDPRLANWDADVETDGLLIDVLPMDADGYLAAASGTIEVELFAPQRRVFHHAPQSGGDTLERVEHWTRSVQASDFDPSGVRLKLPFGAVHPEFDLDWLGVGLVHVKFIAPGHGVFEDSRDAVRIRPFAPLRDQLEMNTGRRIVPTEGVGRRD